MRFLRENNQADALTHDPQRIRLAILLDHPRVPIADDILGLPSPVGEVVLPSPEELAQEPDIKAALIAAEGVCKLISQTEHNQQVVG